MRYHPFLTRRYLLRRVIPYAAVLGVAFGVFALISVLAVMGGFKDEMRERIRGSLSHITVVGGPQQGMVGEDLLLDEIGAVDHVEASAPFIESLAIYKSQGLDYCQLRGIVPELECEVGEFQRYVLRDSEIRNLRANSFASLPDDREPMLSSEVSEFFSIHRRRQMLRRLGNGTDESGFSGESPPQALIVGIEALRHYRLQLGEVVQLSSYSPVTLEPVVQNFIVTGAFQSGTYEQDLRWIYAYIRAVQEFLDLWEDETGDSRISGIAVKIDDYRNASGVSDLIDKRIRKRIADDRDNPGAEILPDRPILVMTWEQQRSTLLQAVDIEKRIVATMMMLVIAFASGMIFLILTLMGIEKTRDIGVLRSLGATRNGVIRLFLGQGLLLCVSGVLLGSTLGWLLVENINAVHDGIYDLTGRRLFPPDVYYLSKIPAVLSWQDYLLVLVPTLSFGFLGSIIPAMWAAKRAPIEALHHE